MPHFASPQLGVLCALLRLGMPAAGWLVPAATLAQGLAPVSGTLTAAPSGAAVEYATVMLCRAADSAVVKTEFSDAQGRFRLDGAVGGRYLLSAAQVGLARYWSAPFALPPAGVSLPPIALATAPHTALQDVHVTARKPLYERRADRTVVNVADNPLTAGATALDVLGRAPGVRLEGLGPLSLQGRQGVLVLLEGKRLPLAGSELLDYLRALPADQLQQIELLTNPPAHYDAQGGAGVIVLTLKKDQRLGTNGSLNASYGRGRYGKFTGGLALNHRQRLLSAYATYAYTDRRNFTQLDFNRQFAALPQQPAASTQASDLQLSALQSHSGRLGLDFTPSARTLVGVSLTGLLSQTATTTENHTRQYDAAGAPAGAFASQAVQDIRRPSGAANLTFRHAFADSATARTVSADADLARYHTTRLLTLATAYELPAAPRLLTGDQRSTLTIQTLKADVGQPLPRRMRLELGAKATRVRSDNEVEFVRVSNGTGTPDPQLSSQFRYDENVNAAYAALRGGSPKTTWQAGLRAEQTNTLAAVAGETPRERHYLQLFPSLQVQHALGAQHALALTLARRIDRPTYAQVNPLRNYFDAASYRAGNPNLLAQTSYNVELAHTFRQKLTTALGYAHTSLPLVNVVQPAPDGNGVVVNQDVNLTSLRYYSLTVTAPLDLTKWWTLYLNGVGYYNQFQGQLNGTDLDRGRVACQVTVSSSLVLGQDWTVELNGQYNSKEVYGFELNQRLGQVGAGVQKALWSKQGSLRLNVADVFYTTPSRSLSTFDAFTEYHVTGQDTRVATLAFTYRFGNAKVPTARKRTAGAEEELRRAAGQ